MYEHSNNPETLGYGHGESFRGERMGSPRPSGDYEPWGTDIGRRRARPFRQRGVIRRFAHWLGGNLQNWAEAGARRFEQAGRRAREFTEEGGERAQDLTNRGERRARHWGQRTGRRMERAGREMEQRSAGGPGYGSSYGAGYGPGYGYSGMQGETSYRHERGPEQSPYMGRGPKGYRRSNERIHEDVCEELTYADLDARTIEVSVDDGEVTLEGTVSRREWKRMAEDVIEELPGVRDIHNRIRVQTAELGEEERRAEMPTYHQTETGPAHH